MISFQKSFGVTKYDLGQLPLVEYMNRVPEEEVGKGFSWLASSWGTG